MGCTLALERGLACSTGGGTHHAFPDHGSGFCLINDMAVAARYTIKRHLAEKVMIVDLDVHQVIYATYFQFKKRTFYDEVAFTHCRPHPKDTRR